MALKPKSSGPVYDPVDVGTYPAVVVQVVDVGLQPQRPYKGEEKKPQYEILFTYEFLDEYLQDENGEDDLDKPRWLNEVLPFYPLTSERAKSTARYNVLDPNNENDGDFLGLLGNYCNVTVVHNESRGRTYANIGGISPMREKDRRKASQPVNAPVAFTLDNPDMNVFEALPLWVQDKIKANLEFKGSVFEAMLKGEEDQKPADNVQEELEDETPF